MKQPHESGCINRRQFLRRSAPVALAPLIVPGNILGLNGAVPPSEKIVFAGIGIGPRGEYDLSVMLPEQDVQFVAVCDVRRERRERIKAMVDARYGTRDCVTYRDFRELLARPEIDAVLIATGDHWHAHASIWAARAGKDVYSEKPCGLTVGEVQALSDEINRTGRVFQAGTQRRSIDNFQYAAHLAWSGKLGRLHTLHASVYVPTRGVGWLPGEPEPDPEQIDWDMWLGPAPTRPYNSAYVRGGWRGHDDFEAGGNFLDWGAHTVDLCQWANRSDDTTPITYEATPNSIVATYASGVRLVCDFLPDAFGNRDPQYRTSTGTCPVRFEGEEGWVETGDNSEVVLSPGLKKLQKQKFETTGLSSAGHGRNFFDCVRSRRLTVCNQNIMRRSHLACFAAHLSWLLGRKLTFDPVKEEFLNDPEANRYRTRATRAPWTL